jgi:TetR/AcrR family transcriptional repressor of lmrAB and yxaGH operons
LATECGSTGELLRAHASLLAGWIQISGFRNGCPITTALLELAPRERAVTEAGRKAYAARLAILSRKLVEDGFVKARADALAVLCTSALQGALIQARVERSGRPIEVTARGAGAVAGGGGEAMTWDVLRVRAHNARDNTGLCCYG